MNAYQAHRLKKVASSGGATFLMALLLTSPIIMWSFDRSDPVTVREFYLQPKEVAPGGKLSRVITVTRTRSCRTDVDALIIDGSRVRWIIDEPEIASPGPTGRPDTYSAPMIVPPLAAPGDAEVRVVVTRRCNPLHSIWPIVTRYEPLKFKILPN